MNKELNEDARTKQDLLYECSILESRLSNEIIKNENLEQQCKQQKEVIDKAIETLEKGITFCENDSQGIYNKCNISINREKKVLDILKEVK